MNFENKRLKASTLRLVLVALIQFGLAVSTQLFAGSGTEGTNVTKVGLWVGDVVISKVSQPDTAMHPEAPVNVAAGFQFRLIVHVDDQGKVKLLRKVLQCWHDGVTKPATEGSTNLVVDQPGRFVLLTDEKLAGNFAGVALRNGVPVHRRFSSAAFGFSSPLLMAGTGNFGENNSVYTVDVVMGYNDSLNPFVHRYHPDHDNLKDRNGADGKPELLMPMTDERGAFTAESYTVIRTIRLDFSADVPNNLISGWGDTRIGGVYRETIKGLHKSSIFVEGKFQLYRSCAVGVLNQ